VRGEKCAPNACSRYEQISPTDRIRIGVDLTPLLSGGANGGVKPVILEFIRAPADPPNANRFRVGKVDHRFFLVWLGSRFACNHPGLQIWAVTSSDVLVAGRLWAIFPWQRPFARRYRIAPVGPRSDPEAAPGRRSLSVRGGQP